MCGRLVLEIRRSWLLGHDPCHAVGGGLKEVSDLRTLSQAPTGTEQWIFWGATVVFMSAAAYREYADMDIRRAFSFPSLVRRLLIF
jgi:hypothetical protein